jgi:hypothetical protein
MASKFSGSNFLELVTEFDTWRFFWHPAPVKVVCLNPVHGEVYSIQHFVIKVVSDLRQVGGFLDQ